jgi:hypothetical protein
MIENFDSLKKQLSELSTVLNGFKSEAVQLRLLELIFSNGTEQEDDDEANDSESKRRPARRRNSKAKKALTDAPIKRKKTSSGTGGNATLNQLLAGPFFDKPRTIGEIVDHCKNYLARSFKPSDFSGKLGLMVRNNELTRKKNADNQYEYNKP